MELSLKGVLESEPNSGHLRSYPLTPPMLTAERSALVRLVFSNNQMVFSTKEIVGENNFFLGFTVGRSCRVRISNEK
jgi:hypothetical protein